MINQAQEGEGGEEDAEGPGTHHDVRGVLQATAHHHHQIERAFVEKQRIYIIYIIRITKKKTAVMYYIREVGPNTLSLLRSLSTSAIEVIHQSCARPALRRSFSC